MADEPVGLPFRGGAGAHPRFHEWLGCAAQKQALLSMGGISHGGSGPELYPILVPCSFRVAGTSPRLGVGEGLCLLFHSGRQDPREGVHSKFILRQVIEETQISQASWGGRLEKQVCPVGGISYT